MARKVRFHRLSLTGFGRYREATYFELGGRSCTFTSANELGKSTFLAGLVATLFGPPTGPRLYKEFLNRARNWSSPQAFRGELDLAVEDDMYRICQDFDKAEVAVFRVVAGGVELVERFEHTTGGRSDDSSPYARLLHSWLGLDDRGHYEAMFTMSQKSSLSTSWQIDPRITRLVYSSAVERLESNLRDMFDRFRQITRNTRDFNIALGSQGQRNGRTNGRLEDISARQAELEEALQHARRLRDEVELKAQRVAELDRQTKTAQEQLALHQDSLNAWRAWAELEEQLKPAMSNYERLRELNEKCQSIGGGMAELRARLGDWSVLDQSAPEIQDQISHCRRLARQIAAYRQELEQLRALRAEVQQRLSDLRADVDTQLHQFRDRQDLAQQIEALRELRRDLESAAKQLAGASQRLQQVESERQALEIELSSLGTWGEFDGSAELLNIESRDRAKQFLVDHDRYCALQEALADQEAELNEQQELAAQLEADSREFEQLRLQERKGYADEAQAVKQMLEELTVQRDHLTARQREFERRFAEFLGAPRDLPELWDELHAVELRRKRMRQELESGRRAAVRLEQRQKWRRGLTMLGSLTCLLALWGAAGWWDWLVSVLSAGLLGVVQVYFRVGGTESKDLNERLRCSESQDLDLAQQLAALREMIGNPFLAPPEREAEWRRLWPSYCLEQRGLEELRAATASQQDFEEVADELERANYKLAEFDAESASLTEEAEEELARLRKKAAELESEIDRCRKLQASHTREYFSAGPQDWQAEPIDALGSFWEPILFWSAAVVPEIDTVAALVDWLRSLEDQDWHEMLQIWQRGAEIRQELAEMPGLEALERQHRELAECHARLELQVQQLAETVAPFDDQTDPNWIRQQCGIFRSHETTIGELEEQLQQLPDLATKQAALEQLQTELDEIRQPVAPIIEQFGEDEQSVASALRAREEAIAELRTLEDLASELVAQSGYSSLEELAHEAGKAEGQVTSIRARAQELLGESGPLWEAVDCPELAAERIKQLEATVAEHQAAFRALEQETADLNAEVRQLEAGPGAELEPLELELAELLREKQQLEAERDVLIGEFREATRLLQDLQKAERATLEGRIAAFFADFSRTPGRSVELDDELRIQMHNQDGRRYSPALLSHGAQDQLYFSVYLAAAAEFDLPFVLDDPFVNCDTERLEAIRKCWERLVEKHQLILLSHDAELAAWAPPLAVNVAA